MTILEMSGGSYGCTYLLTIAGYGAIARGCERRVRSDGFCRLRVFEVMSYTDTYVIFTLKNTEITGNRLTGALAMQCSSGRRRL